ncbi:MAG: AEC family transporter [Lachnospiraceae bacterium]|nr:AEC family transporter [Lachnospiraceae bacterium]
MEILQQMIVLFIIMGIGFAAYKSNIITSETRGKLSSIVVNIANPALILSSVSGEAVNIKNMELLKTLGIAVILYFILIIIAAVLPILIGTEPSSRRVYSAMTVFSNIGFMGFPIISEIYGNEALLYGSLFLLPYNILIYTYGISLMDKGQNKEKETGIQWRKIFNNGVIACVLTLILFITKIPVPYVAAKTIEMVSNLTAPLSMMVIGASLAVISVKEMITDTKLLLFVAIRQLILPVILSLLIFSVLSNRLLCGVCMIMLSTPVGSMTSMLAEEYNGNYELASKGVAITTIVSVISLPVVSYIVNLVY